MKEKLQKLTEMNFGEVVALVKENRKTAEKALLGIIVVVVLAIFLLGGRGEEEISFAGAEGGAAESGLISGGSAGNNETGQSEAGETAAFGEGKIYVYVAGAVETPGVVILNEGDRIFHAIDAAGGFSKDAAGERLNLAQIVEDGDKLYVPTFEELEAAENGEGDGFLPETAGLESSSSGKININIASSSELQSISGIGAVTAGKIISYREANGKFKNVEDIKNVSGIGDATFEKMKDQICVR